jgi:beta-lactamase regulating signal transducer with metallopeptidase domain
MSDVAYQIVRACAEVALIGLVVAFAVRVSGGNRARLCAWLWLLVALKACLVLVPIPSGPLNLSLPIPFPAYEPHPADLLAAATVKEAPNPRPDEAPGTSFRFQRGAAKNSVFDSAGSWFVAIWGIGFLTMLGWNLYGRFQLRSIRKTSLPPGHNLSHAYEQEVVRSGLSAPPRLIVHPGAFGPMVTCGLKPSVVLPCELTDDADPARLRWILRHELTHIRHFDHISMMLWSWVRMIYWFHPAIWWAHRQWQREMERACDDAVAATPNEARHYAKALYSVLAGRLRTANPILATPGLAAIRTEIGQRIERLLQRREPSHGKTGWVGLIGWALCLLAIGLIRLESGPDESKTATERTALRLDFGPDDQRVEPGWDGWSGDKDRDFTTGFDLDFEIEIDRGPAWRDNGPTEPSIRWRSMVRDGLRERDDDSIRIRLKDLDPGVYLLEMYSFVGGVESSRATGRFDLMIDGQVMLADQVTSRGASLSGASLPPVPLSSTGEEVVVELVRREGEIWLNGLVLSGPTRWSGDLRLGKIRLADAPAAVQATIEQELVGATLDDVRRRERNDELVYSVDADTSIGDLELEIRPDGTVLERSEEIRPDRLPVAVTEALRAKGESLEIRKVVHHIDAERQVYRVEVRIDGEKTRLVYDADGSLQN